MFIYEDEGKEFIQSIQENAYEVSISPVAFADFVNSPEKYLKGFDHLVVAGFRDSVKKIFDFAVKHKFSIGILPLPSQKTLTRCYSLPRKTDDAIELSLRRDSKAIDLIYCNGKVMLF